MPDSRGRLVVCLGDSLVRGQTSANFAKLLDRRMRREGPTPIVARPFLLPFWDGLSSSEVLGPNQSHWHWASRLNSIC